MKPPQKNGSLPPVAQSRGREADLREQEIHRLLSERTLRRKGNPCLPMWNCTTLGKEMGYTRQCIATTVQHMIAKGYPIGHTSTKHLYYTESFTPMLAQVITESGLTRLFFAVRAIEALQDSPVFAPVLADLQKMVSALIDRVGGDYAALSSCVTIRNTGIDPFVDPDLLEKLITATRERQELEIVYSKLSDVEDKCSACVPTRQSSSPCVPTRESSSPSVPTHQEDDTTTTDTIPHPSAPWLPLPSETRTAHPLHILYLDHVWYLYLWDPMRKDIRRFVISRMHSVRPTGATFKPRRFNVKKKIAHLLGVTSGDAVKVRVLFRGKASYLAAERPWHHSQQLAPGPDTEWNLELTMEVAHTPELERTLFGYDKDFKVIEPASLVDAIDRKVQAMHSLRHPHASLSP